PPGGALGGEALGVERLRVGPERRIAVTDEGAQQQRRAGGDARGDGGRLECGGGGVELGEVLSARRPWNEEIVKSRAPGERIAMILSQETLGCSPSNLARLQVLRQRSHASWGSPLRTADESLTLLAMLRRVVLLLALPHRKSDGGD